MYDGYDENGDPIQHGIVGSALESSGLTRMAGACIGIVLRTKYADSKDNLLYRSLQDELGGAMKASYLEADVLLVYGGCEMFTQCPHAVVLPQGKSSNQGPGKDEPSDFTEDVPKGCTADELEEYFGGSGRLGLENFSGDWCVVTFIGGLLQTPVISNWFPNPRNKRDAATKADGQRFTLRRNNSELQVDKNGDLHLTHRVGQYLQMRGKTFTLKHREGSMLNFDEDGGVYLANKEGYSILIDSDGVSITDGFALIELKDKKLSIQAIEGDVSLSANNIMLTGSSVVASGGIGGYALCKENLAKDYLDAVKETLTGITAIDALMVPIKVLLQALPDPTGSIKAAVQLYDKVIGDVKTNLLKLAVKQTSEYATKVLAGE